MIVLIDQSASMSATQGGRSFFDRAQEAAEKILKGLPNETATHLARIQVGAASVMELPAEAF